MSEQELLDEIELISTAIRKVLLVGEEYEVGTGQSKRTFKFAELDKLREYRTSLQSDLVAIQNGGRGSVWGF
jgi:hypothetical protein